MPPRPQIGARTRIIVARTAPPLQRPTAKVVIITARPTFAHRKEPVLPSPAAHAAPLPRVWLPFSAVEPQTAPLPRIPSSNGPASRWSGSAWVVLRGGSGRGSAMPGGQLGGGQAGIRLAYLVGRSARLSLVGRVTTPVEGRGREASIGVEWQPTGLPARLFVEQRLALDGGVGGPAIGVIGGVGPTPLIGGFTLESYAQAGIVHRARREPFADGAIRLARPIATLARLKLDIGLGLSGGAQRDATRLDIGPSLGVRFPLEGRSARLSFDWRQRIAGDARPGSGVAITLGSDF